MGGLKINIGKTFLKLNTPMHSEWSKKSNRFDPNNSTRPARRE
jgi:hypothetical protein